MCYYVIFHSAYLACRGTMIFKIKYSILSSSNFQFSLQVLSQKRIFILLNVNNLKKYSLCAVTTLENQGILRFHAILYHYLVYESLLLGISLNQMNPASMINHHTAFQPRSKSSFLTSDLGNVIRPYAYCIYWE